MRIGFIGGGQMAQALAGGLLSRGAGHDVVVSDPVEAARSRATHLGAKTTTDNREAASGREAVVIAVKPQMIERALAGLGDAIEPGTTVISIAAGVTTGRIESLLGADRGVRVVRTMPNTPALVGEGIAAICAGAHAEEGDLARAEAVLSAVGTVVRVSEAQINAVTGVSGSGPAYVYTVIEAMADGGVKMGLPKPLALQLAAQTVLGAARMVVDGGGHPAILRDAVTSPGGTTIAAMHALEREGFRNALISAVEAATKRADELG